ncbi:hypothetical protein [Nocardioides astragali]|uniref:YbjN domain-containing protein n=1 Tax=Nocardioides astragali TaxID=1776736 RepID=A0ABW2N3B1_9ACTN|nr:hypothetical protein [Nocardioides astragali]
MEITQEFARDALQAAAVQMTGAPTVPRRLLAKGFASVLAAPESVAGTPGISWIGPDDDFNSVLKEGSRLVHVRVRGEHVEAAAYGSPVDTLEAVDFEELGWDEMSWLVRTWRVTLVDGTVIAMHGSDQGHAERLAAFARAHLQPGATPA